MDSSLKELEAQKLHYEQEIEKNHAQWSALSSKKVGAQFCSGGGALLFISSLLGRTDPFSGALALIVSIGGAIWWWRLNRQMDELIHHSMILHKALASVEERFYQP